MAETFYCVLESLLSSFVGIPEKFQNLSTCIPTKYKHTYVHLHYIVYPFIHRQQAELHIISWHVGIFSQFKHLKLASILIGWHGVNECFYVAGNYWECYRYNVSAILERKRIHISLMKLNPPVPVNIASNKNECFA